MQVTVIVTVLVVRPVIENSNSNSHSNNTRNRSSSSFSSSFSAVATLTVRCVGLGVCEDSGELGMGRWMSQGGPRIRQGIYVLSQQQSFDRCAKGEPNHSLKHAAYSVKG